MMYELIQKQNTVVKIVSWVMKLLKQGQLWVGIVVVVVCVVVWRSQLTQTPEPTEPVVTAPSISYLDILNNPELKLGVQEALINQDDQFLERLQNKVLEIADAANLPQAEKAMLQGSRGRNLLVFRAKRQIFMQKFTEHYNQLRPIDDLKKAFPEAQDLFVNVDKLIAQRDQNIEKIAIELSEGGNVESFIQQARQIWQARNNAEQ